MSKKKQHIKDAFNKFVDSNDRQSIKVMMDGYYNVIQNEINNAFERAVASPDGGAAMAIWDSLPAGVGETFLKTVVAAAIAHQRLDVVQHILGKTPKPTRYTMLPDATCLAIYGQNLPLLRYLLAWEQNDQHIHHIKISNSVFETPHFLSKRADIIHRHQNPSDVAVNTNALPFIQELCAHSLEYLQQVVGAIARKKPEDNEHTVEHIGAVCQGLDQLSKDEKINHRSIEDIIAKIWDIKRKQRLDKDKIFEVTENVIDWTDVFVRATGIKTNSRDSHPNTNLLMAQDLAPHMPNDVLKQAAPQLRTIQSQPVFSELASFISRADIECEMDDHAGQTATMRRRM